MRGVQETTGQLANGYFFRNDCNLNPCYDCRHHTVTRNLLGLLRQDLTRHCILFYIIIVLWKTIIAFTGECLQVIFSNFNQQNFTVQLQFCINNTDLLKFCKNHIFRSLLNSKGTLFSSLIMPYRLFYRNSFCLARLWCCCSSLALYKARNLNKSLHLLWTRSKVHCVVIESLHSFK